MTREERIEKLVIDAVGYELSNLDELIFMVNAKADYNNGFIRGFKVGAAWADRHPKSPWISVEERLPEEDFNCIVTNKITGGTYIAYY